jgi:hypothetical protein
MSTRNCTDCEQDFVPSSRHRKCPKCRRRDEHNLCACGNLKQVESNQCGQCRTKGPFPWTKGGTTKHHAGYVLRRVPDHPRCKGTKNKYVFEHILVMEEHLGRYLLPGETVHHKYGIRDDNRIEHLELWTRPQPSGIRAEDALEWAYKVIELYGDIDFRGSAPLP